MNLSADVLARIPLYLDQELHFRRRSVPDPMIPDTYDVVLFNVQGGGYTLATSFPVAPDVLDAMIAALQAERSRL